MKNQRCPHCLSNNLTPKGWKNKKRRYKCKDCKSHFVSGGNKWFISEEQLEYIDRMLLERIALRAICRIVKVSLSWLQRYVNELYKAMPKKLNYKAPSSAGISLYKIDTELDEMWSFVSKKANKRWVWIALCRQTRQVIAFHVGCRGRKSAKALWDKIPKEIQEISHFHSDDWDAYKGVIPSDKHSYSTVKKETNHLERFNNTVRQRVARLVRDTLSFSKKEENHIGALNYFFLHYNIEKQMQYGI